MGRQLRVQRPPIRNISDLRDRCLNIWYNLSPVIYQGLVASMLRRVKAVLRAKEARRIVSQRTPTPGVSYASKIKKTFKSCTTQTDSDLNQPNSAAICSSKSETTNSKSGIKSPRKNKHAQLREAKGDGRKKPLKIKKTDTSVGSASNC
ncbi:transposase domain containing protein [Nephila pilipes]|uniref:Transposase domain containing protein n=1 Tax=Nephila pilipes TaxID=299642 RepID=A0A8X6Q4D5_NEPPI|nr:transposase domain containing protein [Nephila pilipes]